MTLERAPWPIRRALGHFGAYREGVGKIVGPLCLAVIAGADNFVHPQATASAVTPAFIFLAGAGLLVGLTFTFLGVEPNGRPVSLFGGTRSGSAASKPVTAKTAA